MRIELVLFEEPVLDWRQGNWTSDEPLFGFDSFHNVDHRRQLGNRLILKKLARSEMHSFLVGLGNHLNAENRIAAELEEVVVDADLFNAEELAPDLGKSFLDRRLSKHHRFL